MLITFKCRAAPDVMMLENLAEYLLGIIGKRLGDAASSRTTNLPAAIEKLEAAVIIDKKERAEHDGHFHEGEEGHEHHEIPIGSRSAPIRSSTCCAPRKRRIRIFVWGL